MAVGVAAAVGVAGCSDSGAVEIQVVTGYAAAPDLDYRVEVETPTDTESGDLGFNDQLDPENWATFQMEVEEGDQVNITVTTAAGAVLVSGSCIVDGATTLGYGRLTVFYLEPKMIICGGGFQQ
jgi:hypothetical protein